MSQIVFLKNEANNKENSLNKEFHSLFELCEDLFNDKIFYNQDILSEKTKETNLAADIEILATNKSIPIITAINKYIINYKEMNSSNFESFFKEALQQGPVEIYNCLQKIALIDWNYFLSLKKQESFSKDPELFETLRRVHKNVGRKRTLDKKQN